MYDDSTTELLLPPEETPKGPRWKLRLAVIAGALVVLALAGFAAAAFALSGATLGHDPNALARVRTEALGGEVERVVATGPDGKEIPIAVHDGRLVPLRKLAPGEKVSVDVYVKRPAAIGWLVGSESEEHLTLRTPVAHVRDRWLRVKGSAAPRVAFDQPVRAVAYGQPGELPPPQLRPPPQLGRARLAADRRLGDDRRRAPRLGAARQGGDRDLVPDRRRAGASPPARRRARRSRRRRRCG